MEPVCALILCALHHGSCWLTLVEGAAWIEEFYAGRFVSRHCVNVFPTLTKNKSDFYCPSLKKKQKKKLPKILLVMFICTAAVGWAGFDLEMDKVTLVFDSIPSIPSMWSVSVIVSKVRRVAAHSLATLSHHSLPLRKLAAQV